MLVFDPRNYGANPNDNTDDTKAIQAALDAARDAGGGHVVLQAGTYIISGGDEASDGALRIYSNTEISGAGMGETILKLADGWSRKITGLIRTPVNQVTEDVIIRDLTLDGNRDNTTADVDGIMTGVLPGKSEHDNRILIERVEIHDVSRIAFNPHEQTTNLIIRDSVAHHNSWDGFIADFVSNAVYENNIAYANDRHGFNVVTHSHDMVLRNNVAYDNALNGIVVQRGAGSQTIDGWEDMLNYNILIEGNTVYNNGSNGILFKQAENSQIIGNTIYGNAHDGIQLEGANEITIDGNIIKSSTIFGIEIRPYTAGLGGPGDSYNNLIINNVIQAVQKAFVESGSTTLNNIYAENLIGSLGVAVGKTATILPDSVSFVYDKLEFTVSVPKQYSDTGNENPTPTPQPEPQPEPETPTTPTNPTTPPVTGVTLTGTDSNNTLEGGNGNDTLKGRAGNDVLKGGAGDDYLEGNDGNDILHGGLGKDTMKGSTGVDTFVFSSYAESGQGDVIVDFKLPDERIDVTNIFKDFVGFVKEKALVDGFLKFVQNGEHLNVYIDKDGNTGASQQSLLVTLQNVKSTAIDLVNFILPSVGAPKPVDPIPTTPVPDGTKPVNLSGTTGNDTLVGSNVADTLKGDKGNDKLLGGKGNDTLWGNEGNDILYGSDGSDWMKGGEGADRFIIDANLTGVDTVNDMRVREGDKIELRNVLGFDDPLHDAIAHFVKVTASGANTIISVDLDGTANGMNFVKVAELTNVIGLGDASKLYADGLLLINNTNSAV